MIYFEILYLLLPFLKSLLDYLIDWLIWDAEWQRERIFISRPSVQVATVLKCGLAWSQNPGTPSWFPSLQQGPGSLSGRQMGSKVSKTWTKSLSTDVSFICSSLICFATKPSSICIFYTSQYAITTWYIYILYVFYMYNIPSIYVKHTEILKDINTDHICVYVCKIYLNYKAIELCRRPTKFFHLIIHVSYACSSCIWARLKPGCRG